MDVGIHVAAGKVVAVSAGFGVWVRGGGVAVGSSVGVSVGRGVGDGCTTFTVTECFDSPLSLTTRSS
jgi:hypothetical protein